MDITPGNPTHGDLHICAGPDAKALCEVFDDGAPMLALGSGMLALTVGLGGDGGVSTSQVMFARELAQACDRFAQAAERLYHAQQDQAA